MQLEVWVGQGAVTPMHRQHSQGGRQGMGEESRGGRATGRAPEEEADEDGG